MRGGYQPMMDPERAERLRVWHEAAVAGGRRDSPITVSLFDRVFVVRPDVYPPNRLGLAAIVLDDVREGDRVLDMGTGSGVNAVMAAARSHETASPHASPYARAISTI